MENRFTPSKFTNSQSASVADGTRLTAHYASTGRVWRAALTWKTGWERTQDSITAFDEQALKNAILKLDPTARFLGKVGRAPVPTKSLVDEQNEMLEMLRTDPNTSQKAYESACRRWKTQPKSRILPAETRAVQTGRELSFADAKVLESMRVASNVSDIAYRNACAKMGVPSRPRPTKAAVTSEPQIHANVFEQTDAWRAFATQHGEITAPPFGDMNMKLIVQYLADEGNLPSTPATLERAYQELNAAQCFRDARVLTRGMGNDFRVVRPYNHAEIVAARRQQATDAANQPPAGMSAVDAEAWQAVRRAYPSLAVNSKAFQVCVRDTVEKWSLEYIAEQHPDWFAQNLVTGKLETIPSKRAEARAAADKVLAQWVRQSNPNLGQGNKTIKDQRVWLG
jgi:hypothetical protein